MWHMHSLARFGSDKDIARSMSQKSPLLGRGDFFKQTIYKMHSIRVTNHQKNQVLLPKKEFFVCF